MHTKSSTTIRGTDKPACLLMPPGSASESDSESASEPAPSFDAVLARLGGFGLFQRALFFALWLPAAASSVGIYTGIFVEYSPEHRCRVPEEWQCQGKGISKSQSS